jgi:hypothetical protein
MDWDAIYEALRSAGFHPTKRGWKFRPDGPVELYIKSGADRASVTAGFDGISITQTGTAVSVHQTVSLDFSKIIID